MDDALDQDKLTTPTQAMTPITASSDEALIAEFTKRQSAVRHESTDRIGDLLHRRRVAEIPKSMPPLTPEQIARREVEIAERESERERSARANRWWALCRDRGDRYTNCFLGNFSTACEAQKKAIVSLTSYCEEIGDRIADGESVVLFGPKLVVWQNGMDLFGDKTAGEALTVK